MAPPVASFEAQDLDKYLQILPNGQRRKPQADLQKCELKEMLQYNCDLGGPRSSATSRIVCEAVLRLFRRQARYYGYTTALTLSLGVRMD